MSNFVKQSIAVTVQQRELECAALVIVFIILEGVKKHTRMAIRRFGPQAPRVSSGQALRPHHFSHYHKKPSDIPIFDVHDAKKITVTHDVKYDHHLLGRSD